MTFKIYNTILCFSQRPQPEKWNGKDSGLHKVHLDSAVVLNKYWSKFFASFIERTWFHRPRPTDPRSLSSASESCEAIAVSAFEDMLSMFSREAILSFLAFGDIDNNLHFWKP